MSISQILINNNPLLFNFFAKIKQNSTENLQTFLFHGTSLSTKESTLIAIIQMLNCPEFSKDYHSSESCKICLKINALKEEYGVLSIITHTNLTLVKELYITKINNPILDPFTRVSFLHELHKLIIILEQQNIKQINGSSKTLTTPKIESLNTTLQNLITEVTANSPLTLKEKDFYELLSTLESLFYSISIGYIDHILQKLSYKNSTTPFRFLIIKDPIHLSSTILNHLLKIIEEPPKGLFIFFITNKPKKILLTIRSRCVKFHFKPLSVLSLNTTNINFPLFPTSIFERNLVAPTQTLNENSSLNETIAFLESIKSTLYTLSPIDKEKRVVLDDLLLGIREYSLNQNHVRDVSRILYKRMKK